MLHRLNNELIKHKELIIAFSGGVDSAFLASVALKLKEVKVTGILLDTPLMKRSEKESALRVAEEIGLNLVVIAFNPAHIEGINTNSRERCYICKKAMIDKIKEYIAEKGLTDVAIADGLNYSDIGEYRPGIRASNENSLIHPLVDAEFKKEDIRRISRAMGLSFADKPSSPCLATRFPYDTLITIKNLRMVEEAEDCLNGLGLEDCRVRLHKNIARIEAEPEYINLIIEKREEIVERFKEIGFIYVCLDLQGYRTGSMEEEVNIQ
ncbi:MAG: ATP-dependent sacrificial sulfur transferase LarE [Methanomicrobium sp.]|nr:ATP-dependent sacrificial sulfur transferase LarE [Methanomicrobium sp.]MBR6011532.1 ATP-dependent sacrificial sulfur transferase LarE [Methanomicrobium sp.]